MDEVTRFIETNTATVQHLFGAIEAKREVLTAHPGDRGDPIAHPP